MLIEIFMTEFSVIKYSKIIHGAVINSSISFLSTAATVILGQEKLGAKPEELLTINLMEDDQAIKDKYPLTSFIQLTSEKIHLVTDVKREESKDVNTAGAMHFLNKVLTVCIVVISQHDT